MIYVVLSGLLFALILPMVGNKFLHKFAGWTTLLPLSLFVFLVSIKLEGNEPIIYDYEWVPSLNISLNFVADGLSLLFGLIITGIGALVYFYSSYYLKKSEKLLRFYALLSVFMAAMLGLVFSNNILLTFIFWEMTSISSFFLIGFNNEDIKSRKSAMTALTITGIGGLFLLGFAILLGNYAGTYEILALKEQNQIFSDGWIGGMALAFILIAAFTKSAQFPLHFWLPGAMKAPTPVSTYLHSATMVKAGVFLLLRFSPHFQDNSLWSPLLLTFGGLTMVYSAFHILFRTDLKSILAYSTISALGVLVFLTGIGTNTAITAALIFLVVHALYKASLFLITGIIDHQTGTRDITKLKGLKSKMMPVAIAGGIVALSSAGLPPLVGFIGKDLIYEASLHANNNELLLTIVAIFTNVLLVYAGFLVGIKPFWGKLPASLEDVKAPSYKLFIPPLILAALSILFGLFPAFVSENYVYTLVKNTFDDVIKVKLWHGFNLIFLLSIITLLLGTILFLIWKPNVTKEAWIKRLNKISPQELLEGLMRIFQSVSLFITEKIQNGYLRKYVFVLVLVIAAAFAYHVFTTPFKFMDLKQLNNLTINDIVVVSIMFVAILFTVFSKSRLAAIAGLGIVGYAMCFIFVYYSAPDLAMTQFTIDTLTVILFVLVLYRLPRYLNMSNYTMRIRDGIVALGLGAMITMVLLKVMHETPSKEISEFYADNSYILAKGKNIVNVILVDFRGFDTLVEIVVLSIAAIGVFGLLKLHIKRNEK